MTPEEQITEFEKRIEYLEKKIALLEHTMDRKDIKSITYPLYYPWTSPIHTR
jgi:chaperonin cofactor prefoldin